VLVTDEQNISTHYLWNYTERKKKHRRTSRKIPVPVCPPHLHVDWHEVTWSRNQTCL